jgi:hypothetical protein
MALAAGLSVANLANKWLDMLRAQAFSAPAGVYVSVHTAIAGASGTNAVATAYSGNRPAITWSAASTGSIAITGTNPSWAMTGGDTITDIGLWDTNTGGTFLWSITLSGPKTVVNGDTLTLTSCTLSLTPIATT